MGSALAGPGHRTGQSLQLVAWRYPGCSRRSRDFLGDWGGECLPRLLNRLPSRNSKRNGIALRALKSPKPYQGWEVSRSAIRRVGMR